MAIYNGMKSQQAACQLLPAVYLIWVGLILGVSFIATPVKFQVSQLTMSVALEVGKVTFHLFNMIEWGLIIVVLVLTFISASTRSQWCMVTSLLSVVTLQTFWLLPVLNIRANEVISGTVLSPSIYHSLYITAEILKLTLAMLAAKICTRKDGHV